MQVLGAIEAGFGDDSGIGGALTLAANALNSG